MISNRQCQDLKSGNPTLYDPCTKMLRRLPLLIMDWAMKFLPTSYRGTQHDWFGKKGKSWHVTVAILREDNKNIEVLG